ncbi:helix-turn-helix domain-containing protein [Shimia thalassica]|uniref:AraC family transcriptional regulator n=1 Tax=Shimia thalassica TaxID=1715693 RepID=UPI001C091692|nr:AraC family transcriptional regulator [Shimia thalassica]MBU2943212.1 AraC family transcriptional regulator [Shimia thalassica]MDO6501281.1 helix-turn-helix domain-containing protein [Shimia thalassica]
MPTSIPMVRGTILLPVLKRLNSLGLDVPSLLAQHELKDTDLSDANTYVQNETVYRIYSEAAELAGNPTLCASIGASVDLQKMLVFGDQLSHASNLADLLIRFVQAVANDTTLITQSLVVENATARFGARRNFSTKVSPAHSDAFMVGLWVGLLRKIVDQNWEPTRDLVQTADPALLPKPFHGATLLKNDGTGFSIQFPAAWLSHPIHRIRDPAASRADATPLEAHLAPDFVEATRSILKPHIWGKGLKADAAADICGYSKSTLGRRLADHGTTISDVLTDLRLEMAQFKLHNSGATIQEIALGLGYSDATAFSRAFKKKTDLSPSQFRSQKEASK